MINYKFHKSKPFRLLIIIISGVLLFSASSYGFGVPLPDISAISGQIESVETSASGAFSALQGLADTLGYAPGASGGPLFNPGPGLSEAMATLDKLTADASNMQEEYQNIIINFNKLSHLVNSVENAVSGINNLNEQINSAFNQIPQELTASDVQVNSVQGLISEINSNINIESSEFQNLKSLANNFNPEDFVSGYSSNIGNNLNKSVLENGSAQFTGENIFNSDGNTGAANMNFNCSFLNGGYNFDGSENPVGGCIDAVKGLTIDAASSGLYNAGVSAARAHKAELEGDEFMGEISGNALKNSSNYYAYQSSILTLIGEENAAGLKNMGYMESQLKQLEIDKSAAEIKKEHVGPVIAPQVSAEPGMNFYSKTTL